MADAQRIEVGIWSELGRGARWANEGVSRVIGFVVEGGAMTGRYRFNVVVQPGLAEEVRRDLRTLAATEGKDWLVHEPDEASCQLLMGDARITALPEDERRAAVLALWCNVHVPVAGWFVSFPFFKGSLHLTAPKATLMPDALGYDFPLGFSEHDWSAKGSQVRWRKASTEVLAASAWTITFSNHVAQRHVKPLLSVPEAKIKVVPLAPPDLAPLLPFLQDRRRSEQSHRQAADLLRRHAVRRKINYLRDFPFEEVDYAVTATQDRVTKNLGRIAEAVRRLVREQRRNFKFITTARLEFGAPWTMMPGIVEAHQFHHDLVSMHDVPREVHAALFHCATVTVHPTFFEGIIGALPFYESLSVGTPVVMARGPHIAELLDAAPGLAPFVFDPYDIDGLAALILYISQNRERVVDQQMPIYAELARYGWDQVATAYAEAAIGGHRQVA